MDDLDQTRENNHTDFNEAPDAVNTAAGMDAGRTLPVESPGGNGIAANGEVTHAGPDAAAQPILLDVVRSTLADLPDHPAAVTDGGATVAVDTGAGGNGQAADHVTATADGTEDRLSGAASDFETKVTRGEGKNWHYEGHWMFVNVEPTTENERLLFGIPVGKLAGKMDFAPHGRKNFKYKTMSENLLHGIKGLQAFFAAIDDGNPAPEVLYGVTNKHMAETTQRLGFTKAEGVLKWHSLTDNRFDKIFRKHRVVGDTQVVRENLEKLLEKRESDGTPVIIKALEKRVASAAAAKPRGLLGKFGRK